MAVRDIAAVIGRHLNLPRRLPRAEGFGFLGQVLAVDHPASSTLTCELLGWRSAPPGLIEDLEKAATSPHEPLRLSAGGASGPDISGVGAFA